MKAAVLCLLLLCPIPFLGQNVAPAQNPDIPKGMKQYFIGFLVKGEHYNTDIPKEERQKLFQGHLAYIRSQAEAGKYRLAGPFEDNGNIGGILIIDTPTAEEARQIVSGDPMVKAGRFALELHPALLGDLSCVFTEYQKNTAK
jgi:uncharacterized protein YciI